ncbi:MAG: hypothetical protein A2931_01670 [Candidatus Niyogibacteria bacterium RIFCSPLOWO2_01_FULL_45_48]|uniref:Uncharacterized protein n=2 Tax=Candidatus Niyogiibacteriota TaxID=1817912 RepID=A0A1G2EZG2_9BACT|nr:MAG: hypothetical protein A2835_03970 [Candidatus Niyogibacteria bacterium RIFCSPHIGHO2_01_FULL_45_28]OGZ29471.1 MAG: hypothetical protein A2931_01670 [Candidatus Niyogibacteria bacterium RIFCSPLOWO2_01_FULL_45_48]OGZ31077.1 MAG: hypothetical protein A3J00_03235 [Candidatus Niyogibacteria bacterium RIFCSPLOWO2_02_FULL_45_13]
MDELKNQVNNIKKEVRIKVVGYITAGFGLVAGLAWNDAIKSLIELIFPLQKNSVLVKFLYAGIITVLLVSITIYLTRLFEKEDQVV